MKLCLALGCTLAELKERLTQPELRTWWAAWSLEPWGDIRTEASIAIVGSAVCGSMGARVRPEKLIPQWNRPAQRGMSAEEFAAWCNAHNRRQAERNNG